MFNPESSSLILLKSISFFLLNFNILLDKILTIFDTKPHKYQQQRNIMQPSFVRIRTQVFFK